MDEDLLGSDLRAVGVEREARVGGVGECGVECAGDDGGAAARQAPQRLEDRLGLVRRRVFVQLVDDHDGWSRDRAQCRAEKQPVGGAQVAHLAVRVKLQAHRLEHASDVRAPPVPSVQRELRHHLIADAEGLVEVVDPAELAEADPMTDGAGVAAGVQPCDGQRALTGAHACREGEEQGRLAGPGRSRDDRQAAARHVPVDVPVHPAGARAQPQAMRADGSRHVVHNKPPADTILTGQYSNTARGSAHLGWTV